MLAHDNHERVEWNLNLFRPPPPKPACASAGALNQATKLKRHAADCAPVPQPASPPRPIVERTQPNCRPQTNCSLPDHTIERPDRVAGAVAVVSLGRGGEEGGRAWNGVCANCVLATTPWPSQYFLSTAYVCLPACLPVCVPYRNCNLASGQNWLARARQTGPQREAPRAARLAPPRTSFSGGLETVSFGRPLANQAALTRSHSLACVW